MGPDLLCQRSLTAGRRQLPLPSLAWEQPQALIFYRQNDIEPASDRGR